MSKNKKIKIKAVPSFKFYIDPKDASKKKIDIGKLFHVSQKTITIPAKSPPMTSRKNADMNVMTTDRKDTMASTMRSNKVFNPFNAYKTRVDNLTDELVDVIRKKLLEIRLGQRLVLNKRKLLGAKLTETKENLRTALDDLESHRKRLRHAKFVKKKLENDCNFLQHKIDNVRERIYEIKQSNDNVIAAAKENIYEAGSRRNQSLSALSTEIQIRTETEKSVAEKRDAYLKLIENKGKEIAELKNKIETFGLRENFRLGRFISDAHSINICVNNIKTMSTANPGKYHSAKIKKGHNGTK